MYNSLVNLLFEAIEIEAPKIGLVGFEDDDGNYAIIVADEPNKIYVRIQDGDIQIPSEAINLGVPKQPDYPVLVYTKNKQSYAIPDQERSADYRGLNEGLGTVAPHSHERGMGLWDVVSTRRMREGQLTCTDPSTMSLDVSSFKYWDTDGNEQLFTQDAIDMTDYIPATSEHHAMVKVYFDLVTLTLGASSGTSKSIAMALSEYDLVEIAIDDTQIPLGGVILTNGMTVIDDDNLIFDWRFWINTNSGSTAVIDKILTDANGDVLSDANGDVLLED